VIKDGGDDPDVTNGASVSVSFSRRAGKGLTIVGGHGVGRVTRPGLILPVGEWAVNPVPRRMLMDNLADFLLESAAQVEISIADGERLAQKTLNPRLGVLGGLSVLGTTGLVKPFSNQAYVATIDSAMSVAKAAGAEEIVLSTGVRSEDLGRKARPDLPEECFVQIADFFRTGLKLAVKHGFSVVGLCEFFGKAVKQAANHPYTHAHHHDMDLSFLAGWFPDLSEDLKREIGAAPSALAALAALKERRSLHLIPVVAAKVLTSARGFAGPGPRLWVRIFDFDGALLAEETDDGRPPG
jgi:cobalt-precorrin-5B (C1)-methyltransferase